MSDVVAVCGTNYTIGFCDKCVNPDLECSICPRGHIMSRDKRACIGQFTSYMCKIRVKTRLLIYFSYLNFSVREAVVVEARM